MLLLLEGGVRRRGLGRVWFMKKALEHLLRPADALLHLLLESGLVVSPLFLLLEKRGRAGERHSNTQGQQSGAERHGGKRYRGFDVGRRLVVGVGKHGDNADEDGLDSVNGRPPLAGLLVTILIIALRTGKVRRVRSLCGGAEERTGG